jgi:peptide/nickel transport system substrate-binding protein
LAEAGLCGPGSIEKSVHPPQENIMKTFFKAALVGASLGAVMATGVLAQNATFVLGSREVGAPSYNPIKATRLNAANTFIYDRMVVQDADQSFHGQLATSWESTPDGMSS